MSEATLPSVDRVARRPLGATIWFVWMVAMWVGFFVLLLADRIGGVWGWVRDLPLVVELVLWVALFPWLLGSAVWTSSWAGWLRLLLEDHGDTGCGARAPRSARIAPPRYGPARGRRRGLDSGGHGAIETSLERYRRAPAARTGPPAQPARSRPEQSV